jgi:hypothetical protein
MWTIVRFSLSPAESDRYPAALDLLARGGFGVHVVPAPADGDGQGACGSAPHGTVAGDVHPDTALVTRCVFTALQSAGFTPVMVSARYADRGEAAAPPAAEPAQPPLRSSNQR